MSSLALVIRSTLLEGTADRDVDKVTQFLFKFLCETYVLKICYIELH